MKKRPFLVAEISANHCGSLNLAKKLIKCAKKNGADAVKLQTYTPKKLKFRDLQFFENLQTYKLGTFKFICLQAFEKLATVF